MPLTKEDLLEYSPQISTVVVIGENHLETDARNDLEQEVLKAKFGQEVKIFQENDLPSGQLNDFGNPTMADCVEGRCRYAIHSTLDLLSQLLTVCENHPNDVFTPDDIALLQEDINDLLQWINKASNLIPFAGLSNDVVQDINCYQVDQPDVFVSLKQSYSPIVSQLLAAIEMSVGTGVKVSDQGHDLEDLFQTMVEKLIQMDEVIAGYTYERTSEALDKELDATYIQREKSMIKSANLAVEKGQCFVWKIGEKHMENILDPLGAHKDASVKFVCISKDEFDQMIKDHQRVKAAKQFTASSKLLSRRCSI